MFKKTIFFALICLVSCAVATHAQSPAPKDDKFAPLLAKLKAGDTKIDFKELRMLSLDSKAIGAGVEADRDSYKKAFEAMQAKKARDAVKAGEKALESGYLDTRAHMLLALANEQLGDTRKYQFHKAVYLGLMNSILDGADGVSAKTAYVVINVSEEYAVVNALQLQRGSQRLMNEGGHKYDVLTVTDPKTGKTMDLWFNIDMVWKGYEKLFK